MVMKKKHRRGMPRGRDHQTLPRMQVDTDVWTLALERTAHAMTIFDQVAVAFSGGKDSTAVMNVALEVAHSDQKFARHLPLRCVFYDEEAIPQETADYVERISKREDVALEWLCLPVQHRNACSRHHPYWWPWAPEDEAKWCRPLPEQAITRQDGFPIWPQEARLTIPHATGLLNTGRSSLGLLMGIRAQESLIRTRAVTRREHENYIIHLKPDSCSTCTAGNIWKVYPIYDWTTADIWTATGNLHWDYNRAYDLLEMAGISAHKQRCSPAFGEEPLEKIHTYAQCFPDVWAKMAERVPGIGAAHRYALTELWCYRDRPDKPAGMPWPTFLLDYVYQFKEPERTMVTERLRDLIRRHYRRTTHPILPKTHHPVSGVCWDFLLMIAMRGDFKRRKQEKLTFDQDPRLWGRYARELAALTAAGVTADELGHPTALPGDPWALVPPHVRAQIPDQEGETA